MMALKAPPGYSGQKLRWIWLSFAPTFQNHGKISIYFPQSIYIYNYSYIPNGLDNYGR
jgi:hypothetical protein